MACMTDAIGLKKHSQLILLQMMLASAVLCGNVLIWPTEGSHWLNVKVIIQELVARDHNVTVVVSSASPYVNPNHTASRVKYEIFQVPFGQNHVNNLIEDIMRVWMYEKQYLNTWQFYKRFSEVALRLNDYNRHLCNAVLKNSDLMRKLHRNKFDVLLSDPVNICGDLVALKLGIPFVYSLRFTPASTVERHCGKIPTPPSYVPATLSEFSDTMSLTQRLENILSYIVQDAAFQSIWGEWDTYYSNVLEGSHWLNMKFILEELVVRGHRVTVLVNPAQLLIESDKPSPFNLEWYSVPFTKDMLEAAVEDMLKFLMNDLPDLSYWETFLRIKASVSNMMAMQRQACDSTVLDTALVAKLRGTGFDVLLSDPLAPCGELVAELLGIPFLYTFRFSMASTVERLCGQIPAPPSYVPATTISFIDQMPFMQRVKNVLSFSLQDVMFLSQTGALVDWNRYFSKVLGKPTTFCETMGKAEIWLIRTYWDFEYPRPLLPNFEFVGGLHCQPARPLPEEMENFVQSSGDHGIVVFSLGSMVKNLTDEKSTMIAAALSQLPQKVLWRYSGKKPDTLGPNTKLYDWMPQNDLLGHPKTKAFISHGGTNGIYEAIYHGVPMVGIPLFADQPDNMAHMKSKGMAVVLDFNTMTTQDLVDAVNTVIVNSTYKDNALRLSRIHHDQPMKPLDRAVFWIEFVMRHKGAKHLRPAAHNLTWYQYHCLDVIAFLLACLVTVVFTIMKCCMFLCRKCGRIAKKKKD
ncbi:UDP-glucuronosyltransferase 2A2-like isoform X3 [Pleurodeles waltl]|uniref:UDP-glucuronosyltransferase 2A2-like isoform X3 n=2 Tax=Pleurodeles waltl TaxID=8319 RepID=UPI0037099ED5